MNITLEIDDLNCFDNKKINVDIAKNITTFVGPNGAGKTTLLLACSEAFRFFKAPQRLRKKRSEIDPDNICFAGWKSLTINFSKVELEKEKLSDELKVFLADHEGNFSFVLEYDDDYNFRISFILIDDQTFVHDLSLNRFINEEFNYDEIQNDITETKEKLLDLLSSITESGIDLEDASEEQSDEKESLETHIKLLENAILKNSMSPGGLLRFLSVFPFPEMKWVSFNDFEESISKFTNYLKELKDLSYSNEPTSRYMKEIEKLNDYLNVKCTIKSENSGEEGDLSELLIDDVKQNSLSQGTKIGLGFYTILHDTKENSIIFWDEPENSMHTTRRIKICDLMLKNSRRFVLATHQTEFCPMNNKESKVYKLSSQFKVGWKSVKCNLYQTENLNDCFGILKSLGMEPSKVLFTSNCILWLEGPSDAIYWRFWIKKYLQEHKIELLEGFDYTFLFYGGSGLNALELETHLPNVDEEKKIDSFVNVMNVTPSSIFFYDTDLAPKKASIIGESEDTLDKEDQMTGLLKPRVQKIIGKVKDIQRLSNECFSLPTYGREIENYISSKDIRKTLKSFYSASKGSNEEKLLDTIEVGRWDSFDVKILEKIEDKSIKSEDIKGIRGERNRDIAKNREIFSNKIGFANAYVESYFKSKFNFNELRCGDKHIKTVVEKIIKIKNDYNQ